MRSLTVSQQAEVTKLHILIFDAKPLMRGTASHDNLDVRCTTGLMAVDIEVLRQRRFKLRCGKAEYRTEAQVPVLDNDELHLSYLCIYLWLLVAVLC